MQRRSPASGMAGRCTTGTSSGTWWSRMGCNSGELLEEEDVGDPGHGGVGGEGGDALVAEGSGRVGAGADSREDAGEERPGVGVGDFGGGGEDGAGADGEEGVGQAPGGVLVVRALGGAARAE